MMLLIDAQSYSGLELQRCAWCFRLITGEPRTEDETLRCAEFLNGDELWQVIHSWVACECLHTQNFLHPVGLRELLYILHTALHYITEAVPRARTAHSRYHAGQYWAEHCCQPGKYVPDTGTCAWMLDC